MSNQWVRQNNVSQAEWLTTGTSKTVVSELDLPNTLACRQGSSMPTLWTAHRASGCRHFGLPTGQPDANTLACPEGSRMPTLWPTHRAAGCQHFGPPHRAAGCQHFDLPTGQQDANTLAWLQGSRMPTLWPAYTSRGPDAASLKLHIAKFSFSSELLLKLQYSYFINIFIYLYCVPSVISVSGQNRTIVVIYSVHLLALSNSEELTIHELFV